MSDQKQRADANSVAIQSGRDTNVHHHHGVTIEDVQRIIEMVAAREREAFTAIALQRVEERLKDYNRRVIERFSDPSKANPEAFKDPDFQYLLSKTQHAYARSGDYAVRDILIDLIASRSKQTDRTRLSLTLNDAVEKAALLTRNEFAELSLCYFVRLVGLDKAIPLRTLALFYSQNVRPLLPDISLSDSSYLYIAAHSCAVFNSWVDGFTNLVRQKYAGILSAGFTESQLDLSQDRVEWLKKYNLLVPCLNDSTKLQFNAVSVHQFRKAAESGFLEAEINRLWQVWESTIWNGEDLIQRLETDFPCQRSLKTGH